MRLLQTGIVVSYGSCDCIECIQVKSGVEHLISSIKSVVRLKPLRVWKDSSVDGALLMAQLLVSLRIVDFKEVEIEKNLRGNL